MPKAPTAKQKLEAAIKVANASNNQFDRTEAKVDALAKYILLDTKESVYSQPVKR